MNVGNGIRKIRLQKDPYSDSITWTYGNWGGGGWSGGIFTGPDTEPDFNVEGVDLLDNVFKKHDKAYTEIENAWENSPKNPEDIAKYWNDTIIADGEMRKGIQDVKINNGWGDSLQVGGELPDINMANAAIQADRLFAIKQIRNQLSYDNLTNPDGTRDPYGGDPFTGMPWAIDPDPISNAFNASENVDPIILDLNGDGVTTTQLSKSFNSGVHFNLDARGLAENTGWVDASDGLLVRDLDGNGKITTGRELFGNHTLLKTGKEAVNGFEALRDLDDNGDGVIDSRDAAFTSLNIWKDINSNGLTDNGELFNLSQASIKSLSLKYLNQGVDAPKDAQGNQHQQLGSFTKVDGSTQKMDDVALSVDTARTVDTDRVSIDNDLVLLPDAHGMGNVRSLRQSMARDATGEIKTLVQQWQSSSGGAREAVLDKLIYRWAEVQNVDSSSRGGLIDARQLAALENFLGTDFIHRNGSVNPSKSVCGVCRNGARRG